MNGEETGSARRSYSLAQATEDLATYQRLKRSAALGTLLIVTIVGLLALRWLFHPALALVAGGCCGVFNALLVMRSGERLVERRSTGVFVLSSLLRIGLFGIVPVTFAVAGPWWSMAWYFAGFFLPLGIFAYAAQRAFAAK
jgi:multisubunit Na+/H+ antiporter MnhB subunit